MANDLCGSELQNWRSETTQDYIHTRRMNPVLWQRRAAKIYYESVSVIVVNPLRLRIPLHLENQNTKMKSINVLDDEDTPVDDHITNEHCRTITFRCQGHGRASGLDCCRTDWILSCGRPYLPCWLVIPVVNKFGFWQSRFLGWLSNRKEMARVSEILSQHLLRCHRCVGNR